MAELSKEAQEAINEAAMELVLAISGAEFTELDMRTTLRTLAAAIIAEAQKPLHDGFTRP